jgi:hypothetical protein
MEIREDGTQVFATVAELLAHDALIDRRCRGRLGRRLWTPGMDEAVKAEVEKQVYAEVTAALASGDERRAAAVDTLMRMDGAGKPCGADVNALLATLRRDGSIQTVECPACGLKIDLRPARAVVEGA